MRELQNLEQLYPVDVLVDYGAHITATDYHRLYEGREEPEFIFGMEYAPLRAVFQDVPPKEQREEVKDVLLSTGGSDELHIALSFVKYLCEHPSAYTYHILLGAMNQDMALFPMLISRRWNNAKAEHKST